MLEPIYLESLTGMLAAEKKYTSCFKKLSGAASTDELRRALSPETSDQHLHTQRLILCLKMLSAGKKGIISALDQYLLEYGNKVVRGKVSPLEKDLAILHTAQQILQQNNQVYAALQQMAVALGMAQAAELLEQCCKDGQNTYNYLLQISQNIIYPLATSQSP